VNSPTVFAYTDPKTRRQSIWTVERTCAAAAELLDIDGLASLKMMALQAGLKAHGMERLYEKIMGEKLP
jgi:aryl carrier-like protein